MATEILTVLMKPHTDKKKHNRFLKAYFIPEKNSHVSFAALKSSCLLANNIHSIHTHWNLWCYQISQHLFTIKRS